jgi:hypothetical protein
MASQNDPSQAIILSVGAALNGGTANSTKPVITGTADAGTTVNIYDGVKLLGTAVVAVDGTWSYTPTADLKGGVHSFTAISVDNQGHMGASSDPLSVQVGSKVVTPNAPDVTSLTDNVAPITGAITNGTTTNDPSPTLNGTGTAGNTIKVYDGATLIGSTTVNGDGTWSVKPVTPLANGAHDVYATQTNSAGTSGHSTDISFKVDTTTPATPAAPTLTNDSNEMIPAGGTTTDGHPHISGTGAAGDTIMVYDGGTILGSTTVTQNGTWTFTSSTDMASGAHSINVTETNAAGTASEHSAGTAFTLMVPPTETVTITNLVDDSTVGGIAINVPNGGGTADASPIVQGIVSSSLQGGETLTVYRDGVALGHATVVGTSWSYMDSGVPVGTHKYTASVTNAGTSGTLSAPYAFTEWATAGNVTGLQVTSSCTYNGQGQRQLAFGGTLPPDSNGNPQYLDVVGYDSNGNRGWKFFDAISLPLGASWWDSSQLHGNGYVLFFVVSKVNGVAGPERLVGFVTASQALAYQTTTIDTKLSDLPASFSSVVPHTLSAAHGDASTDTAVLATVHDSSSSATDATPVAAPATSHPAVGEHDAFVGHAANGYATVDLQADPSSYFKESTAHIQGAGGAVIDTLHLTGANQVLDLTSLTGKTAAAKISGIEVIDLGGLTNSLKLSLTDVLNLGERDLFQKDGKQQLMVKGSDGDAVDVSNGHIAGLADGQWQQEGSTQVGGVTYNVYEHSGAHTELLVQQGVQIALHN